MRLLGTVLVRAAGKRIRLRLQLAIGRQFLNGEPYDCIADPESRTVTVSSDVPRADRWRRLADGVVAVEDALRSQHYRSALG